MKRHLPLLVILLCTTAHSARAEFLFDAFLEPLFFDQPNTEFSEWNTFYAPNGGVNYPDIFAPNGIYQSASAAGFSNPGDWSPANPLAFWHLANPTITQNNGGHFIIGPGTLGNIYSPGTVGSYTLTDSTPYTLGTVLFQFQTEGTLVDFDSIRLEYSDGNGIQSLAPDQSIREYRATSSAFGGFTNRTALQWDLTGLGVTSYQIVYESAGSSMSFQRALLDTAAVTESVVPEARTWTGTGSQQWSQSANWLEGSPSSPNGNVTLANAANATITLDSNRTIGELIVATADDTLLQGTSVLTVNTGITTANNATGLTTIATPYALGAFNLMNIQSGGVRITNTISGAYGMIKTGSGTLTLAGNNTFGTASAGLGVQGGTLRIEGTNTYGGSTSVLWGTLEVAANAPNAAVGALGNASSAVIVGASSTIFSTPPQPAQLVIDGNHTIGRTINVEQGTFEKRIGAQNSTTEALYSGNITLLGTGANATNLKLFAANSGDIVRFSGNLSGGATTSTLSINADGETGTVIFSDATKTYSNATSVQGGTLVIASGTSTTGNGAWTVGNGATLQVDGQLGGSGTFTLASGGTLTGSGTVNKSITIGDGAVLSPGNSPGTLTTLSQTWAGGGSYLWEINDVTGTMGADPGWDWLTIDGTLTLTATHLNPFELHLTSLTLASSPGVVYNFDQFADYTWTIATASGGIFGFDADAIQLNTTQFTNFFTGSFALDVSGNHLILSYTAIPEPSSALLLGIGSLLLLHRRRARHRG